MTRTIENAISAGLESLARMQVADGSFPFFVGSKTKPWAACSRLFATSYIMLGAGRLLPPEYIARTMDFIRSQRRPDKLWIYDPRLGIPPDSDSSSCSLAALAFQNDLPDAGRATQLLRSFWRADTGPFRTWNAPGMWARPDRDDPVVNCNILLALRLLGSPATVREIDAVHRLFQQSDKGSRYYGAPSAIAHAAKRAGLDLHTLPAIAIARPPERDLLGCAQWLCAMNEPDDKIIDAVLDFQRPDGSWPLWPWVTGEQQPFWGSAAVTTALALEALIRHSSSPERLL